MIQNMWNINVVVTLLKKHGIRYLVISPGGTNKEFAKVVQDDSFFKCFSVVDERSAMYFAIGLYLQTGEIVATSCTSAQATRNYIPGLTEAFYKEVPILAITMEKHPRFKYQGYMQAPDQTSLPKDCVKKAFELPSIQDETDMLHSVRLINESILELSRGRLGPVQLCIPWLDNELDDIEVKPRIIKKYSTTSNWDDVNLSNKRIMILIGEHRPFSKHESEIIDGFCDSHNAMVYVNHISNFHGKYSVYGSLSLWTMSFENFESDFAPDIIITIGGLTGDYPLFLTLSRSKLKNTEHWSLSQDGRIVDTYDKLSRVFQCDTGYFFNKLTINTQSDHDYYNLWSKMAESKSMSIEVPFSSVYVAEKLHNKIPSNSCMDFAILNSLRVWSFFRIDPSISCYSNVGAFGIDGGLSTMLGQSVVTDELCFMIIGDLAFCYDMNCLSIRHIKNNVRILLVNNNGGIEFKLNGINNKSIDKYTAASGHFKNAQGWAEACGFRYLMAENKTEFDFNIDTFVKYSDSPILFEIFTSDIEESDALRKFREENSEFSLTEKMKNRTKNVLRKILK